VRWLGDHSLQFRRKCGCIYLDAIALGCVVFCY
jgi:hypothetical protein